MKTKVKEKNAHSFLLSDRRGRPQVQAAKSNVMTTADEWADDAGIGEVV